MRNQLCEMRFDVPLSNSSEPRQFERGWRETLAAQKLTALAMPPAQAVSARFRLCGLSLTAEQMSAWERYLPTRLSALPGSPTVAADPPTVSADWQGVRIWLAYPAQDLAALLQKSKKPARKFSTTRGHRR